MEIKAKRVMKVKNLYKTGKYRPDGYDSWVDYWESLSGILANRCACHNCNVIGKENLKGAHVKKVDNPDNKWYIIPLCDSCNKRTDEFYVFDLLVPVNP